jgi:8-oxo-dGTP diphosphatase
MASRASQAPPQLAVSATKRRDVPARDNRPAEKPEVRAAGGVLVRTRKRRVRRRTELALVHRPRYDDWTFPKGKRDAGDSGDEATALREVEEETGFTCVLGAELGETRYRDAKGRSKLVRYWLMELPEGISGDGFVVNREVDELRWCTASEADRILTYEHDRVLLAQVRDIRR